MDIRGVPYGVIDWSKVEATRHAGTTGTATWRTVEKGNVRVRIVEYSPGYLADHWCQRGHVVHVLEGEIVSELEDGRISTLRAGDTYHVGSGEEPHRSRTGEIGARLLIVD